MNRREFICSTFAGLGVCAVPTFSASDATAYTRANTDWLAKCRYGIGIHWTAQTAPRTGDRLPFRKSVETFKLNEFVEQVKYAGADYVLFTAAHALQMLPAPNAVIDRILPGRTCGRDLIGEMADALAKHGVSFMVYWNHSCNGQNDPEWRKAVAYDDKDKNIFAANLINIVAGMGSRYGEKVKAWWFDSSYSLDPGGPHNSVTTDMTGFNFPWERLTVAAKTGFSGRLVTYNAGVAQTYLYTTHQDYWAGELVDLKTPAKGRYLENGLQWFGWTCLDDRRWVHSKLNTEILKPLYPDDELIAFVRTCNTHQAPMTFNVGIYQDGVMAAPSVEQLRRLGAGIRS